MRTLEQIQADIRFLQKQKQGFFSRLFSSNESRIEELRKEEFKCLDQLLLESDPEYKDLATQNLRLLEALNWKLVVTEATGRKSYFSTEALSGRIDERGQMFCEREPSFTLINQQPYAFKGKIDHYGKLFVKATELHVVASRADAFQCSISGNGDIGFKITKYDTDVPGGGNIISMRGLPFDHGPGKLKEFLGNRKKLYQIINKKRC